MRSWTGPGIVPGWTGQPATSCATRVSPGCGRRAWRWRDSAAVLAGAVDTLAALRTPYWLGDSAVGLHALASLIAQAHTMIPDAVHAARDQGHTWAEIGQLLNLSPAAAARRYRTTT